MHFLYVHTYIYVHNVYIYIHNVHTYIHTCIHTIREEYGKYLKEKYSYFNEDDTNRMHAEADKDK
jgi:hypothetical protein